MALLLMWTSPLVLAQSEGPSFSADVFVERSARQDQGRVILHTRIAYGQLSFVQTGSRFEARYDIMAEVFRLNERGRRTGLVLTQIERRQMPPLERYRDTRADSLHDYAQVLLGDLPPGRYQAEVRIEDHVTRQSTLEQVDVVVTSFSAPVTMSSILLMEEHGGRRRLLRPNVANDFNTEQERVVVSYSVYAQAPTDARFSYVIYRMKGHGDKARPEQEPELFLSAVEARRLQRGTNRVATTLGTNTLRVGTYLVEARVETPTGAVLVSARKTFELRWMGLERQTRDLGEAIAQLAPIAKRKELQAMLEAKAEQERLTRFQAFWKKRDPTPRTDRNERMEEYYYRAWFADSRFSTRVTRGWRSDRGRVFLRFGAPDKTASYPINERESFEVWTYEHINRRFIFIDRSGEGQFELFRPIWDERNRIR